MTPDGQHIISGCGDGSFKVFNLETKEEIHHFTQAHKGTISLTNYKHNSDLYDQVESLT